MKTIKINPATRTAEYAEMNDAEILRFVGGYIVEMTDLNNGLAVHADLISNGKKFVIDDIEFAGNAVITGITGHGLETNCPDDVFPVIEWR